MSLDPKLIRHVVEAIDAGREDRVLLLLPTHRLQALAREAILSGAGRPAARRLGVLSFYQFVQRILQAAGVEREPVDDALRRFIVRHLLAREASAGRLPHFGRLAETAGLAAAFDRLIGELKLAGITPEDLAAGIDGAGAQFGELVHLYRIYQEFLAARGLADKEELQLLARDALRRDPGLLRGYTLLLEGFFDLTPVQASLLREAAAQAELVDFCLAGGDPGGRVEAMLGPVAVRSASASGSERPLPLRHLAEHLFAADPPAAEAGEALALLRAGSPEREVRRVAKEIKRLIREEGAVPGEVAVLAPDLTEYGTLIAAVFAEEGVPADHAAVEPLDRNPLVRAILMGLECALGRETGFDLLKLARSGYLPGEEEDLAVLRRVFRERGYLFRRAEWERRLAAARRRWERRAEAEAAEAAGAGAEGAVAAERTPAGETGQVLEGLRRAEKLLPALLDPLDALPSRAPLGRHLAALEALIGAWGLEQAALAPWAPEELRARDWTALGAFREVLGGLARAGDLLPETGEVPLAAFVALLRAALTEARLPSVPAAPGGVAVMPVTQSRGLDFPYVFYLGLIDGKAPRPAREDWLLPEALRRTLVGRGLALETAADKAAREKFLFRLGVTRATRRLYLRYPEADEAGTVQLASPFLAEVRRLFPAGLAEIPERPADGGRAYGWISTRRELSRYVWGGGSDAGAAEGAFSSGALAAILRDADPDLFAQVGYAVAAARRRAAPKNALNPWTGGIALPAALARLGERRGPACLWSAGHFGDYKRCPFRYFLQRELLAPPVEEAADGLTPLERGQLIHEALHRYYREGGAEAVERSPEERQAALASLVDELFDRSPARALVPHPVFWEAARQRVLAQLEEVLQRDAECYSATGLAPRYLEWGFGLAQGRGVDPASVAAPLVLDAGEETLTVVGKVDRVDTDASGRFVIYDYKTGSRVPSWRDEEQGRSLQLRLYLRAVAELLLPGGFPAGAAYYHLKADGCEAKEGLWHKEAAADLCRFNRRRAGIFTPDEWEARMEETGRLAVQTARAIREGRFPLTRETKECWNCRFRAACRVDEQGELEEEEP